MNHHTILFSVFLSAFVTASAAQEPSSRIDLAVVSDSPFPRFVVVDVSFAQDDSQCPEDRGVLQISRGTLACGRYRRSLDPRQGGGGRSSPPMMKRSSTGFKHRPAICTFRSDNSFGMMGRGNRCSCRSNNVRACHRTSDASSSANLRKACARQRS